jgi:hypothetical protein
MMPCVGWGASLTGAMGLADGCNKSRRWAVSIWWTDFGTRDGQCVTLGPQMRLILWSQTLPFGLVTGKLPAAFL